MTITINKKNLLYLLLIAILPVASVMLTVGFSPIASAAPDQAQCNRSGGEWLAVDGGYCSCPNGQNSAQDACLPASSSSQYTLNKLANLICANETGGVRNLCVNNIINNGATSSQIANYCQYETGSTSSGEYYNCVSNFQSNDGAPLVGTGGGNSGGSSGNSGVPILNTGCANDAAECADNPDPLVADNFCTDSDEICARDSELDKCNENTTTNQCLSELSIMKRIATILNLMTVITVPLITLVIIIGGVQYSMATGDPGKVSAAKKRITNAVIALASYVFLWAFLQWLIPGGVF